MLMFVTHFPLLYLQIPGGISLFFKEFLLVLRLQDLQLEKLLFTWKITDEFDPAYLRDTGHNIYFEQLGYNSRYIVRNCIQILFLIAIWTLLCIITYIVEFAKDKKAIRKGKLVVEKPTFGDNGRVKQYRSNYFHMAVQGLTRILQMSFLEVAIFVIVNFEEFSGESQISSLSRTITIILIGYYALFFAAFPIYKFFLQNQFTVQSMKNATKPVKKKKQKIPSMDREPGMDASSSSADSGAFKLRRQSTMSVDWDEKVIWPGLQSMYLGLTQNRDDVDWYIGWYFIRRVLYILAIVYLQN